MTTNKAAKQVAVNDIGSAEDFLAAIDNYDDTQEVYVGLGG